MAFDVPADRPYDKGVAPFFESVRGRSVEDVTPVWERLSAGATVLQELEPSPWAPAYGMLTDRFGVTWVIDVATDAGSASASGSDSGSGSAAASGSVPAT